MTEEHASDEVRRLAEHRRANGDLVGRLVRLADASATPPREATARLAALLRPAWQREVAKRRVTRRLRTAGALAAAAALLVFVGWVIRVNGPAPSPAFAPSETAATVAMILGKVEVARAASPGAVGEAVTVGDRIAAGATLISGRGGRAALQLARGQSLRVDEETELWLESESAVTLRQGAVYVDAPEGARGLVIRSAVGDVRDVGTQFEVRLVGGAGAVSVREGAVMVSGMGEPVTVWGGTAVTLVPGQPPERRVLTPWAAEWQWTQAVAPPFPIAGRSAAEFLAWVARESGYELAFASAVAEELAANAVLHGRLVAAAPLDGLPAVLAGCGLHFSRRDGRLIVEVGPGNPR